MINFKKKLDFRHCEEANTPKRSAPLNDKGFSLVELSVVLVVAGIALAGILSSTHLLQAAKLNKVISEITGYVTAVNNFKDKYKAWPGDMPNATSYWGAYVAGPPITGAHNGNGDDNFDTSATAEKYYAWRHLALAGMISGMYTSADAGTPDYQGGVNMPASSIKNGIYSLFWTDTYHIGGRGNFLQLAVSDGGVGAFEGVISPADAHIIDAKIDDGLADKGNIYTLRGWALDNTANRCISGSYLAGSATYVLTDFTVSCRMFYWIRKDN